MIKRKIPSSGEMLPVVGLGTWQTFDVNNSDKPELENVLRKMYISGGSLIDSSPMYGKAEQVIGDITSEMEIGNEFLYATKVWINGLQQGIQQMETSMRRMKRGKMDLIQIHNLTDWQTHLPQLRKWKESGKIRYTGLTHYTDSNHAELERIIRAERVDFIQFNYSILSRNAESRLLDVAADLGVATIINRPLGEGNLFSKVNGKSLPPFAVELGIESWAAYFLKYIIANPAVTCVIPATSNPAHAEDNCKAGTGVLPDMSTRKKMIDYLQHL